MSQSKEHKRINKGKDQVIPEWLKWGPYVSERSWGTVREDYSTDGNAWYYFPHEKAQTKAFRWGEDGIAGWCDRYQVLVLCPAFWNGKDPCLKERFFGLNLFEGNHGEDVKEYYYHLDGVPSHSYMKFLYKYPQREFPYRELWEKNKDRGTQEPEFELVDTKIFEENRYFDIFIEYAKDDPEGLCIKIEVCNRAKEAAPFHLLLQMLFRNQWSWDVTSSSRPRIVEIGKGILMAEEGKMGPPASVSSDYRLGKRYLYGSLEAESFFTENETVIEGKEGFYKDAFHQKLIFRKQEKINPHKEGSKAALYLFFENVPAEGSVVALYRFSNKELENPLKEVEKIIAERKKEADAFYEEIYPKEASIEEKQIQRQALASMTWSKQIYLFDVQQWLKGDNPNCPPPEERWRGRNRHWKHLNSMRIMLMPDKWEYPWFAAWDHAFHSVAYSMIDLEFAKEQLWLLLFDQFQHPNGQIPAYEWDFSDLNPPVHAWALLRLYHWEKEKTKKANYEFLEKCFHKLLLNFTWWVNKVDNSGNNVFEGGFLGLDNITVLDRSQKLPDGATLQQSDGTGWMAMFSLNLMRIALELSQVNRVYEGLATKFFQHYVYIAYAMKKRGNRDYEMWSERDGFFYDVLTYPDGSFTKFRVRSLVGLIPLFAVESLTIEELKMYPEFYTNFTWFLRNRKDLVDSCIIDTGQGSYVLTLMNHQQLQSVLRYVWNPEEFRSTYGLRSMSRFHEKHPFVFKNHQVGYEPAESLQRIKGGNSNWRGPIWAPTTFLLIESLRKLGAAYGESVKIAAPGEMPVTLMEMAHSFSERMISLFKADETGARPVFGPQFPYKLDPYWKDYLLFHEYYHPETGRGMGASHQTGWSALIARLITENKRPQ